MPRTAVHLQPIAHPSAWTGRQLGGRDAITVKLSGRQLAAIDELLGKTRHLAPQEVTRDDFCHADLVGFLGEIFDLVQDGRGIVLISGLTRDKYSEEDMERVYWGFGTHWGKAAVQSSFTGERLGHVTHTPVGPDNPANRPYKGQSDLVPHTDSFEIVGLLCLQKAASGGESEMISTMAVYNEILKARPDLLEPLYRGFPRASRERAMSPVPLAPVNVPIYSCVDGVVSSKYNATFIKNAAKKLETPVPADLAEALDFFETQIAREDLILRFTIEPGEMLIFNNFVTLHARRAFADSPTQKRHLLRMWLDVPNGRPAIPEYYSEASSYEKRFVTGEMHRRVTEDAKSY